MLLLALGVLAAPTRSEARPERWCQFVSSAICALFGEVVNQKVTIIKQLNNYPELLPVYTG